MSYEFFSTFDWLVNEEHLQSFNVAILVKSKAFLSFQYVSSFQKATFTIRT